MNVKMKERFNAVMSSLSLPKAVV